MIINKNLMSINHTALKRSKKDIQWIVVHYVGALGDAKANTDYYKSTQVGASADFWVGFAGDVWQGNDYYSYYSWHCGGGYQSTWTQNGGGEFYGQCTNKNSIGIEMCVRKKSTKTMNATDTDWYFEQATIDSTAQLIASLMKELDIDINHVIRHYQVNRKICPNPFVVDNNAWNSFKNKVTSYYSGGNTAATIMYRVRKSWSDEKSQIFAGTLEGAKRCADANPGYYVYDEAGKLLYGIPDDVSGPAPTAEAKGVPSSKEEYILKVANIAMELYPTTKILPSVIIAQAFLENGGGVASDAIELTKRNNLFGLKASLLNSTWQGHSVWDGTSFQKVTPEYYNGKLTYITDSFRVYPDYKTCILDYEMFLTWVKSGGNYKYRDVVGMTDPTQVITIISTRGYATDPAYIQKVLNIINQYDLTKFDKEVGVNSKVANVDRYIVAKAYENGKATNQLGAFSVLDNAKKLATTNPGYYVFDRESGKAIFPVEVAPTAEVEYYRVATDYKNNQYVNQKGAYTDKNNAINAAKAAGTGYKVYSPDGQIVYSATPPPVSGKDIYAVRRLLKDVDSQIGLFSNLDNAKKMADNNWGYNVYNIETNKAVYKPKLMNWQKFCASAIKLGEAMLKDLEQGHQWVYAGSGEKTFAKAQKKGNYKTNCSGGVYWILCDTGILQDRSALNWYGTYGGIRWLSNHAEADARKVFDLIYVGNKTVVQCIKDGTLHPGDIITYMNISHTNAYLGKIGGVETSFDSGHNNCSGSGNGAKFRRWVSPLTCGSQKIAYIMRLKENTSTVEPTVSTTRYRVQCGAYLIKDNANNMLAKVKAKGYNATIVTIDGEYIVQLGLFENKANADALAKKVTDAGIHSIVVSI